MARITWGQPWIAVAKIGTDGAVTKWQVVPTPIENSTTLTPTKGEKVEAKIEGGENEAVKYKKNTFAFSYDIRDALDRAKVALDRDGVIDGEYAVILQPEDKETKGIFIQKSGLSVEDKWSSTDGTVYSYIHEVFKPEVGNQVKHGIVTKTVDSSGNVTALTFKPEEDVDGNFNGTDTYNILTTVNLKTKTT